MLIKAHRQEALSRAYIAVIAARCGFSCSVREYDYGVDTTIHEIVRRENRYRESGFRLDVQAKSTITAVQMPTQIQYDLDVQAYNDLRLVQPRAPGILVLLLLPSDEIQWTSQSEAELEVRGCAYWVSLSGMPATTNKRTVRISIPRLNVFSVAALHGLMTRIRNGEPL